MMTEKPPDRTGSLYDVLSISLRQAARPLSTRAIEATCLTIVPAG